MGGALAVERLDAADIARALPRRDQSAHKGDFGRVLIVAGGPGMAGAARLAGEACLRGGAGLVTVASVPENLTAIVASRPELICHGVTREDELVPLLNAATVVAVGPGLGTGEWSQRVFEAVVRCGKPLVMDADALNLLALAKRRAPPDTILTPHPGEAARLLGTPVEAVQADRLDALAQLIDRTGACVVLKGSGTLVGMAGQPPARCDFGNPAMAAPGMGDVLTGVIAAILAQCHDRWLAARAGVVAHALAGDDLAGGDLTGGDATRSGGSRVLLALDLAANLSRFVR